MITQARQIKSVHKRFDQDLHDQYDKEKYVAIEYFKKKNMTAVVNPVVHGVDLIVKDQNGKTFYCEVEVKENWIGEKFDFPDIHVLYRKKKYFQLDKPTVLMMFNYGITHALFLRDKDIMACIPQPKPNKFVKKGEYFFYVPLDKAIFVKV